MKNIKFLKRTSLFIISALAAAFSCTDEERITASDTQAITEESISDAYFEDADDMASIVVFVEDNPSGGRQATSGRISHDERIHCATISFSEASNSSSGQITIDFSANQLGYCIVRGNKRQGKIILNYSNGPRGNIGFTVQMTFENYKINEVELKGTRTVTRVAASTDINIKHEIILENGLAIWPDNGGEVTRSSEFTREWVRDPNDERVILNGSANGTNRRGKDYTMEITQELVFRRACILSEEIYMAVKGEKVFNVDGKTIKVNYGDGTCDRSITLTVKDVTRDITVGGK